MQGKRLIFLTNYYPYYKGEEYIENEIVIAAEKFNEIIIIPTMVTKEMKLTRPVPKNCKVLDIKVDFSIKNKILMTLKNLPIIAKNTNWFNLILKECKLNPLKIMYSVYYLTRVEYVYDIIKNNDELYKYMNDYNIIIYSYWMHVVASVAARLKDRDFNNNVKSITRGHRYDLYDYASPMGIIPDRAYTFNQMNLVLPCSTDGVNYLKNKYPEFSNKISVQRLGTFNQGMINCLREPVFTLVSCSGVRKIKRLDKIIKVLKVLMENNFKIKWIHLGDGPELSNIKKMAERELIEGTYEFVGNLNNKEVYNWYKNNNVSCFINLSDSEGVPVSIMEAMSFGIPIVATNVGGTKEIVDHGINGYIVDKDSNIYSVADIIAKIISMPNEEFEAICVASYKIWKERANAETLYSDFYKLLELQLT